VCGSVLKCVAVCCRGAHRLDAMRVSQGVDLLQCGAVCCSVWQSVMWRVAVYKGVLECVIEWRIDLTRCVYRKILTCCSAMQCVAVRCSELQCMAVCCSAMQCVAVYGSVLQRVLARGNMLQWVVDRERQEKRNKCI